MIFYPQGWELSVDNPGFGQIDVLVPAERDSDARPLVVDDWRAELRGPDLGAWLDALTTRAFEPDPAGAPTAPLPPFVTPAVARGLLPAFQRAVTLAVGGTDRFERVFPDSEDAPAEPLCVRCNKGSGFSPPMPCDQVGHTPFGSRYARWNTAEEVHTHDVRRWETRRALSPAPEEWTTDQVLEYLTAAGRPIARSTWEAYVARDQAPAPARRIGRTPVWNERVVRAWNGDQA